MSSKFPEINKLVKELDDAITNKCNDRTFADITNDILAAACNCHKELQMNMVNVNIAVMYANKPTIQIFVTQMASDYVYEDVHEWVQNNTDYHEGTDNFVYFTNKHIEVEYV